MVSSGSSPSHSHPPNKYVASVSLAGYQEWMLVSVRLCGVRWHPVWPMTFLGASGLLGQTVWGTSTTTTDYSSYLVAMGYRDVFALIYLTKGNHCKYISIPHGDKVRRVVSIVSQCWEGAYCKLVLMNN